VDLQASRLQAGVGAEGASTGIVNSILRDWIKGQVTAIECGILSLIERVGELLPKPNEVTLHGEDGAV
jgi:hypothetical protein